MWFRVIGGLRWKEIGTDGHRVTALMYTHVAHAVSATAMCTGEKNLAAINVREKFLSSTLMT